MKVIDILRERKKGFSIEILPPLKGAAIAALIENITPMVELSPAFIDVTYHREEYIYKRQANGLMAQIATRRRPGTVGICAALKNHFNIEMVPHIIGAGFSKENTEEALIDLDFLGIENMLVLRGDDIKGVDKGDLPQNYAYASDLVEQVVAMNRGQYLHEETIGNPTNFCIGVAGYPEKHFEAPSFESDIRMLKRKVELGADYIITQMFFDNQQYIDFVHKCRAAGIQVPIIPGLKPITSVKQLYSLPRAFHISFPDELIKRMEAATTPKAAQQVGMTWCVEQTHGLLALDFVSCVHYYAMSNAKVVTSIIQACF